MRKCAVPLKSSFIPGISDSKSLVDVALGRKKSDLVIINANLLNVYTAEFQEKMSISIHGKWIAYVGPNPEITIGPGTRVIDAKGKTVIPGLIEGHTHMAWLYNACEFLKHAVKGGTTTLVTEAMEPYPVCGLSGVLDFLAALENQPIKIFATAPASVSISQATNIIQREDLAFLINRDDILGLGETYWQSVLQAPDKLLDLFQETLKQGKVLEGHSAGAGEHKLNAYIATGISSCHEPINAEQVLERLRLGLWVMIREGSIRRDLREIAKIARAGVDLRRLLLVTDSLSPKIFCKRGIWNTSSKKPLTVGLIRFPPFKWRH